jgi:hypothetical protein
MTTNTTPAVSPIAQIEALYDRLSKAKTLGADGKVSLVYGMADHYIVEGSSAKYLVNGECLCPDATNRTELLKGFCKHRFAPFYMRSRHPRPTSQRLPARQRLNLPNVMRS